MVSCVGKHKFVYIFRWSIPNRHAPLFSCVGANVLSIFPVAMQNAGGGDWGFKGSPGSTE